MSFRVVSEHAFEIFALGLGFHRRLEYLRLRVLKLGHVSLKIDSVAIGVAADSTKCLLVVDRIPILDEVFRQRARKLGGPRNIKQAIAGSRERRRRDYRAHPIGDIAAPVDLTAEVLCRVVAP